MRILSLLSGAKYRLNRTTTFPDSDTNSDNMVYVLFYVTIVLRSIVWYMPYRNLPTSTE